MEPFLDQITIGDKYDPAMKITDQAEADAYFELCVEHSMRFGNDRAEAERIGGGKGKWACKFCRQTEKE